MKKNAIKEKLRVFPDRSFVYLTYVYLVLLLSVAIIACFFAYNQRREKLFSKMNLTLLQLRENYQSTLDNFWQLYMPIYEKKSGISISMQSYFNAEDPSDPFAEKELLETMQQMLNRDNKAQWIALISENRDTNYILFRTNKRLLEITDDFPYWNQIDFKPASMEIYETKQIYNGSLPLWTYAISGNFPSTWGNGKILVGYGISEMNLLCQDIDIPLDSLNYLIYTDSGILYDSAVKYSTGEPLTASDIYDEEKSFSPDKKYDTHYDFCGNSSTIIGYRATKRDIFLYAHRFAFPILLIVLVFAMFSMLLYYTFLYTSAKEIAIIRQGLNRIGENQLDYQIPLSFKQSGMAEIAASINAMTVQLKENINRAYDYKQKQKEAELSDLYTKFNPHFLYNSLEMLCSRCYQNGDEETAELITQLSAIFRGLISSKTFIPLTDELTFCKRYIALFGARYGDQVSIRYNFSTELLQYGIIRNIFQPLIENYFVHGFETSSQNNYILFSGQSLDEKTMLITVEDNGSGMSDTEIAKLNAKFTESTTSSTESYGLKNLHQRLRLFYGDNCGLQIVKNAEKGITIQMTLLKLTCEEVEKRKEAHAHAKTLI